MGAPLLATLGGAGCSSASGGDARKSAATTNTNATLPGTEPEAGAEVVTLAGNDAGAAAPDAVATDALAPLANADADAAPAAESGNFAAGQPEPNPLATSPRPAAETADAATRPVLDDGSSAGHIVYLIGKGWNSIAASVGATAAPISQALDSTSPGSDSFVNLASDGAFYALNTNRLGCSGDCLGLATANLATIGLVGNQGANARPAVAAGGNALVVPQSGGPHATDLYLVKRDAAGAPWGAPLLLTGASTAQFHHDPSVSYDGSRVTFDCGPTPYQANASDICDVALDGSGFRVVVSAAGGPGGSSNNETHHPAYAPDGTIVFEADWGTSERIWRIGGAGDWTTPVLVTPAGVTDDNSPCVLPDGRIASLWLGRSGNPQGLHELKVMQPDGTGTAMLVENVDVVDVGLSCGK